MYANLLFICTGNYYRSRFAEAVFNYHASARDLPWRAGSRGLAVGPTPFPLSPFARSRLQELGIPLSHTRQFPLSLSEEDLAQAAHAIALQEREHRPMIARLFPEWVGRIRFWDIDDVDRSPAAIALPKLENHVLLLLNELAGVASETGSRRMPLESPGGGRARSAERLAWRRSNL
ncbi:arsenate reductase [Methylacidimicrobium cyclopophantes]|uniref:Arsenate reductase n=1 Tax=Methylacidimicrobium cyclopophantes TaxID=1041766 RepID=A0A5E6M754_9BACT|nr:low molecular weight phosphatase family protein [Methylacidimicrobium cyclopophantes]VVM05050.1 arsenate reductase [Methylacidimicrobium cyclopophantes]